MLYPVGYDETMVSLDELRARHEPKMHPVYADRLFGWIEAQQGVIGIGGGWRDTQPDKPGFAPDGKSFHQTQRFRSGLEAYCAVDLVRVNPDHGRHLAPVWPQVPAQGSAEARRWGLHCNVGTPPYGEPWHMQPVEIDGWASWAAAGRPDPVAIHHPPADPLRTIVTAGDGYWSIAERVYGYDLGSNTTALQEANGYRDLHPGDLIVVPGKAVR